MEQKLILISGSPCIGKTTMAEELYQLFDNSAYLDGDWVWHVNPFSVKDPRLRDGDKNCSFVLNTYLELGFEYVFYSSVVLTDQNIREKIINGIDEKNYKIIGFSLMCSKKTLSQRHRNRGDENDISFYWLDLGPYFDDYVINTDNKTPIEIAEEIKKLILEN